jgi:hypothetical protein
MNPERKSHVWELDFFTGFFVDTNLNKHPVHLNHPIPDWSPIIKMNYYIPSGYLT